MPRAPLVAISLLLISACDNASQTPLPSGEVMASGSAAASVTAPLPVLSSALASATVSARPPPLPASATWPAPDAPPPDEAAWAAAAAANNIAPEAMRATTCSLKRISQWFRVQCKGTIRGANMGTFNRDYFTKSEASGNTLTLRARPGEIVSADVTGEPPTFIHIGWASDDPEPGFAMMVHSLQRDVWYIMSREPGPPPIAVGAPSPQPREADFLKGANVSTTDQVRRYPKCITRMLRDWLLVSCETTFANLVGAGTPGKDYFIRPGTVQPTLVILPLREGMDVESRMTPGGMFRVKWPTGERAPTRIETEKVE
jgi:hypothetical protein